MDAQRVQARQDGQPLPSDPCPDVSRWPCMCVRLVSALPPEGGQPTCALAPGEVGHQVVSYQLLPRRQGNAWRLELGHASFICHASITFRRLPLTGKPPSHWLPSPGLHTLQLRQRAESFSLDVPRPLAFGFRESVAVSCTCLDPATSAMARVPSPMEECARGAAEPSQVPQRKPQAQR